MCQLHACQIHLDPDSHQPIPQSRNPQTPNRLEALYKVSKKEGGKTGLRPPSYTDRVLVHSLPDERQRLRLKAYDLFETVTSSDHRPVGLCMELMVQRDVVGFEHVHKQGEEDPGPPLPFHIEAAICLCEVAISGLRASLLKQGRSQIGEARILYPSLPEDPLKAQRAVLKLHDFVGFDHSRHYGSVPAVSRVAPEPSAPATTTPPPPLMARVTKLFSTYTTGTAGTASTATGSSRGLTTTTNTDGGGDGHQPPSAPVPPASGSVIGAFGPGGATVVDPRLMDPALLKSLHCFRWSDATREPSSSSLSSSSSRSPGGHGRGGHSHERAPVRFATLASLEHSTHALVKLVDKRGEDLGQGVICLRGLIRRVAARNKPRPAPPPTPAPLSAGGSGGGGGGGDDVVERGQQQASASAAREEDVVERVTVELSRGGEYRGVLECQVSLRLVGLR